MREDYKKRGTPSTPNPIGLSIVPERVVQCAACAQPTDFTDGEGYCTSCGAGLNSEISDSHYSGYEPNLVSNCHEIYHLKPTVRTVNERRHPRIPCRSVKACIKTAQGSSVVVSVVNISRGGICFTGVTEFRPGAPVSVATHYIEGGQNIYQDGQIIRVHCKGSASLPGVYAVEFSGKQTR